ncbi:DUF6470 family protein [Bacillus sp. Cr_A10]|uniref:DUF6470 family protein n=1 Tax=Bacillus sp. Cr_A10 TaxID=3033993 RepID=UPI0023DA2CA8|nr:DUF6470 family protein [Bacillus sp. Cr_A10]MDF2065826.1 DUF6470 family protein [Bacillus sp. Cr_A10]
MRIPQIQIQTTKGQLGLNIEKPSQHIEQPKADLQIRQPAAEVSIRTTDGQLHIDSSQARRDLGLIAPLEFSRNYAQKGRQAVLSGIARRAREGEQLASIENGGNAIQAIAASKVIPQKKALGIKFVPSIGSVKTTYTPASIDINVQTNKAQISATVNKPIHNYTQGKVSGYMMQYPSIEIDVIV